MWLFIGDGFVSAVEDREDSGRLLIRARDRASLELLLDQIELAGAAEGPDGRAVEKLVASDIVETPRADYRYRVAMTKETFAVVVQHYILNHLTYDNFKNHVEQVRGKVYHDILLDVWFDHRELDDRVGKLGKSMAAPATRRRGRK